ncbi:MAG: hypothetical protein KGN34_06225 [Sphingomonadales bacterium]|nr:hypothetical protein [Sphingomonadales bacterium]
MRGVCAGLLAFSVAGQAGATPGPKFRDFGAEGTYQPPGQPACIAFAQPAARYDPVDLYKAARACIAAGRFVDAVPLYTLAEVYGRYDALRVVDSTTHAAAAAARTTVFADVIEADHAAFNAAAQQRMSPAALPQLCADLRGVGPPAYYPRYMIQHGERAFSGVSGDGLVPGFDSAAAWTRALDSYLHCPA